VADRFHFGHVWNPNQCRSFVGTIQTHSNALQVLRPEEEVKMHSLIYIIGLIVVIVFVLSLLGLA
jgi:hypothetical protein